MKKRNIMILMISLSLVLLLGSSYALLRSTEVGSTPYVINVGSLQVTFEDDKTDKLTLENMYPMSDDEGSSRSEELSFVVKNTGNIEARYNVYLEELSESLEFKNHIRFIVKKNEHDYTSPKTLGSSKYIDANAYLETNQSASYKVKLWLDEEADNTYMSDETSKKEFKAKVVIESMQNTNEYDLYDISGNNYNAKFMNGAKVITDENSRKAISFDGEDDYVDVDDLPATIDFASGFNVEFEAEWKALNKWSRIFDFGNLKEKDNYDNIFVASLSSDIVTSVRYDNIETKDEIENAIIVNEKEHFKITYKKIKLGYELVVYKNDEIIYNKTYETENLISNALRTSNYLGKSNFAVDEYFNGLIYNLKITDSKGTPIIWYDLNW